MRIVRIFLIGAAGLFLPTIAQAQTQDMGVHSRLALFVLIYVLGFCVTILLLFIIAHKGKDHEQK
jgi:DMSO reductase anchor subunit